MISRHAPLVGLSLSILLLSCSSGDASSDGFEKKLTVGFFNESQFTVESLFLHDQPLNYKEQKNLLEEPLAPGESITDQIPAKRWYVTVYRRPNQDSEVLAYTTATAWDSSSFPAITYYDEQFRVGGWP